MSIIVEGMDNTGKSTLCRDLAERFYLPIIDRQGRPSPILLMQQILSFVLLDPPAIFDRHPLISEVVYTKVLKRHEIFHPPLTYDFFITRLLRTNPLIIYCRPSMKKILEFNEPQMRGVVEHAESLVKEYDKLMRELSGMGFDVAYYNYESELLLNSIRGRVCHYLQKRGEL